MAVSLSTSTYPKSMMYFHISGLLFVLAAYGAISMTELFPRGSLLGSVILQTHFFVGFLVLLLVFPRFLVRVKNLKIIPPIIPELSRTNQLLAHAGHIAIYIWMVLMPLLGWATVSARYGSVNIFGIQIPSIVEKNIENMRLFGELHEVCGSVGMFLILGHGAIALWHHYKRQDTTLIRMFPWWKWGRKS